MSEPSKDELEIRQLYYRKGYDDGHEAARRVAMEAIRSFIINMKEM